MEDFLPGALRKQYNRHFSEVTSLSCYIERQLPLREPFFQLKRVPHFQVRDDLHHCDVPAYNPIPRLENATPEDLSHRGRAGCRRVLVEGEIGTGKTFLCYHLLHQWAESKSTKLFGSMNKAARIDDISTFKVAVYVDCVRLPITDILAKCKFVQKHHVFVIASALLALVSHNENRHFQERVYDWLDKNQSDVCVIFDNVDCSDAWLQIIDGTLRERHGFGKILVCVTHGRVPKKNIDSLFYCYGLHPDYSNKLLVSKLKRASKDFAERASIPKQLDSSQELLRNPLTLSMISMYLKEVKAIRWPKTQFDFIEDAVSAAMVGDPYPVRPVENARHPEASTSSLMSICETVAFECLESNTNYFCKFKFPAHFWSKHLCDCRLLHEIHDVANQGSPVVSFTSRCIRDYLASKRVCRYLLSDRDSGQFLAALVHKRHFHPVVKFCIRQFVKLGRLDMVRMLLERLLAAEPKRWIKAHSRAGAYSRGRLCEQKEVLSWLRETDFCQDLVHTVASQFPAIMELSNSDCLPETIMDFARLVESAGNLLGIQGIVIYMDGLFMNAGLGLALARALRSLPSLTTLVVCLRCVVDTSFVVSFLCELFDMNHHITSLTLEGPFNSAENLTPAEHRRVRQVFTEQSMALRSLALDHVNYHHRVAYLLSSWPAIFEKLEIRKCNLDNTTEKLTDKLARCQNLTTLILEHCHVTTATLEALLQQINLMHGQLVLKIVFFNLLSPARHFTRSDAKKHKFKPSLTLACCRYLSQFLAESQTLRELGLCYNGIDDLKFRMLAEATTRSCGLTSLDLTGNIIGDNACDDVIGVMRDTKTLQFLFLHENNFTTAIEKMVIKGSLDRTNLKLSL